MAEIRKAPVHPWVIAGFAMDRVSRKLYIGGLGALRLFQAEFVINQLASPRRHVYILQ